MQVLQNQPELNGICTARNFSKRFLILRPFLVSAACVATCKCASRACHHHGIFQGDADDLLRDARAPTCVQLICNFHPSISHAWRIQRVALSSIWALTFGSFAGRFSRLTLYTSPEASHDMPSPTPCSIGVITLHRFRTPAGHY